MLWPLCFRIEDGVVPVEHAVVVRPHACKAEWEDWLIISQFSGTEALAHPV